MANDSTGWAVNGWKVPGHSQYIGAIVSHQQAQAKSILRTALFIKLKQIKNMYALFLLNNTFVKNYLPDPLREETSSIPLSQGLFWMISSVNLLEISAGEGGRPSLYPVLLGGYVFVESE